MPKRKQPEGEAAGGGGGPFSYHGSGGGSGGRRGGYNNGHNNYQGHGNWGNTLSHPTPHPNYNQKPQMGQGYNQNFQIGQGYNTYQGQESWENTPNYPMPHPNYNPQMGPGYNQNPQMGQGYNQNFPMKQGYNTYQFEPNVPWQPGNEPSNPFSQSHQASQTQQSQNNGGQQRGRRKMPKKSHKVEQASLCRVESDKGTAAPKIPKVSEGGGSHHKSHRELHHQGAQYEAVRRTAGAQAPAHIEPTVCGMCKLPGHEVIQCWAIGADGFTHGCGVCNSGEHETDKCQGFPKDIYQRIEILVKRRACLPPLRTAFWYNMMWKWVKKNPSTDVNHPFPWTTQFAIDVLNGDRKSSAVEEALVKRRNDPGVESSEFIVDPATADWEKVKETYGGEPKNFFAQLKADNAAAQEQPVANASAQAQQGHAYVANERNDITLSSSQSGQHTSLVPSNSQWSRPSPSAYSQPRPCRRETSPGRGPAGSFSTANSDSKKGEDDTPRRISVRHKRLGTIGIREPPPYRPPIR